MVMFKKDKIMGNRSPNFLLKAADRLVKEVAEETESLLESIQRLRAQERETHWLSHTGVSTSFS